MTRQTHKGLAHPSKKEILAVARNLYGEEKIRACRLAGREDLALRVANEEITRAGPSYHRIVSVYPPYDNWPPLKKKKEFDRKGISYSPEAVTRALKNVALGVSHEFPDHSEIKRIDDILEENG